MKNKIIIIPFILGMIFTGCGDTVEKSEVSTVQTEITTEKATAPAQEVGYEGMSEISANSIKNGTYNISVDSSSSMFKITECELTVEDGTMYAKMTMSGTGYAYLFMGKSDEAIDKNSEYIPYEEENGVHSFTVPVEALDKEIECAAFSKKKEEWYDRTLVFRADSLPAEAFADSVINTVESLKLEDGNYKIEVGLEGGSGKVTIQSPANLKIENGIATAEIIWSSNKYDYMIVDEEKYLPVSMEENSIFEIPVTSFDYKQTVLADTIAMSTPHEIEYTLYFDSATLTNDYE